MPEEELHITANKLNYTE